MGAVRKALAALLLVSCAGGCATTGVERGMSSFEALGKHERGEIVVVDVRSAEERAGRLPRGPVLHVQFGPDRWRNDITFDQETAFVRKIERLAARGKPLVLLCQYGVRSGAAVRALRRHRVEARSVEDGYLGNELGPGWAAWD